MRLSDVPSEKLKEIERFLKENWGKYPLVSRIGLRTMSDVVEEKFGVRLSPSQLSALYKGEKTVRVKLPIDLLNELEREFGSVADGIRALLRDYQSASTLPDWLKPIHRELARRGKVPMREFHKIVAPMLPEGKKVRDVLSELGARGLLWREEDHYVIAKHPRPMGLPF